MSRAVNVSVVTVVTLVLYVCRRNRDAALSLFGRVINLIVALNFTAQCCLAMVNVTNRAYIYMRLPWST